MGESPFFATGAAGGVRREDGTRVAFAYAAQTCGAAGAVDPRGAAAQLDGPVGTDDDARTAGDAFFR